MRPYTHSGTHTVLRHMQRLVLLMLDWNHGLLELPLRSDLVVEELSKVDSNASICLAMSVAAFNNESQQDRNKDPG